ncbi:hypothetical protein RHSIM_Rhsim06G0041700 [Rhododendron simsii]|uniref:Uncharacterized protein n=1 Tax=Rhododendron simsii TaxID=118357 RepID=A0A834GSC0_RHOSS|nr:hypothetical protein RHSIM_Rhsim06G0041700 [Rhododendron simsii]
MVETGNHQHQPPAVAIAAPPLQQPLGGGKGPVYGPTEQLTQLHYCIHSNPSWRQSLSLSLFPSRFCSYWVFSMKFLDSVAVQSVCQHSGVAKNMH